MGVIKGVPGAGLTLVAAPDSLEPHAAENR
jgi:hypothetical protein